MPRRQIARLPRQLALPPPARPVPTQPGATARRCLREIRAVAELPSHPHIVGQYRAWQEGGHFYIQMDYCQAGSLHQALQQARGAGAALPDEALWRIAGDVACGLRFLHSHGVLHLDIKPENIYRRATAAARLPPQGSSEGAGSPKRRAS